MSGETIELLKGYDPKKMHFPAYMSQKLDGVPVRMMLGYDGLDASKGNVVCPWTRQGELLRSIPEIVEWSKKLLTVPGSSFVGELWVAGKPFKEISGLVRQHAPAPELQLWVFDADIYNKPETPYELRMAYFKTALFEAGLHEHGPIKIIPYMTVENDAAVQHAFDFLMRVNPGAEGVVVHSKSKPFQPGKRCWGTQRLKPSPTLDLRVVSYEEAIDKHGVPKGMIGRINVEYGRHYEGDAHPVHSTIGVGPGNLTHAERTDLWNRRATATINSIIEVKYMTDDTYEALRQPTFVRFRPDKTEADVHHV